MNEIHPNAAAIAYHEQELRIALGVNERRREPDGLDWPAVTRR